MAPTAETAPPTLIPVALDALFPSPLNPRKKFTDASLAELADNIHKRGEVVQPLLLRTGKGKSGVGKFEIIDGERRYRASKTAGNITHVLGLVRDDMSDPDAIEFMLLSSIQKQELTPLEEAGGFKALIDSNKAKYSALYIADRIGRSEKFVWDRMKLLDLIPILKKLLEAERILVGHAELLAKLKPEDQERVSKWRDRGYGRGDSGLWEQEDARLDFDGGKRPKPTPENLYAGLKPITVKELETYIAEHIRFDVEHMAKSAPLEFASTAEQVKAAEEKPGRGKKVISITHDYRVDDAAKDPSERTYGSQSWRRADGQEKSKTCEFSVLGVFVAGPGYGTTLQVCVNRDKCQAHFGKEIREREKNATLRAKGKGGRAAQNEAAAEARRQAEAAKRDAEQKAWHDLKPKAEFAAGEFVSKLPIGKLVAVVAARYRVKAKSADAFVRALAVEDATEDTFQIEWFAKRCKPYGFDLVKWIADQKKAAAAAPAKKAKQR